MRPLSYSCRMRLRAIAVGIVAVAGLSALAAADEVPTVLLAGASTMAFAVAPAIAPPPVRPRPIPLMPTLAYGATAFQEASGGAAAAQSDSGGAPAFQAESAKVVPTTPARRRSCVVRELAIAGAAIGAGFLLDDTFEPGSGDGTAMDNIGQFAGSPFTLGAGTAVLGLDGLATHHPRTVGTAKRLLFSLAATTVTIAGLKQATNRERPDKTDKNSFPSGHAGASFAAATVLDRSYGLRVGLPAYGFAGFVAASRVVGNRHFFSDVMAGAVIGRFFGRLFTTPH
ncbi:MAG TPA: phosphatase PAP2 family protein [Candidatus Eisenbacteria bacterium]|nr:phosphatase PAP2 family protein [Candidatus Eisenbacteria bacterium]